MSTYEGLQQGLESFFQEYDKMESIGIKTKDKYSILKEGPFLFSLWGKIPLSDLKELKEKIPTLNLLDMNDGKVLDNLLKEIRTESKFTNLKNETSFKDNTPSVYYTMAVMHKRKSGEKREILKDEILNLFLRLTRYPAGSLIPLIDLLDKEYAYNGICEGSGNLTGGIGGGPSL